MRHLCATCHSVWRIAYSPWSLDLAQLMRMKFFFSCHIDSCAAMNTANPLLRMWIITTYPEIVHRYEHYVDVKPFQPILLDCAIPTSNATLNKNKLTTVVTYYTRYVDCDGNKLKISFGFG